MQLRIAGYQMEIGSHIPTHAEKICAAIQHAHEEGADILLTPEGSLSGYTPHFNCEAAAEALAQVTAFAKEKRVGLALGTCFREADGFTYNQIRFYASNGDYLGYHSKILRCGTMTLPTKGEINDYSTSPLKTFLVQGVSVGGLICNDMWANPGCTPMPDPFLCHQLAQQGAKIILHAVNGGRDGSQWSTEAVWNFHEANLRLRAAAECVWIVTVDNSAPASMPCSAPCGVINPQGQWVCRTAPQGEQFFVYTLDLSTNPPRFSNP